MENTKNELIKLTEHISKYVLKDIENVASYEDGVTLLMNIAHYEKEAKEINKKEIAKLKKEIKELEAPRKDFEAQVKKIKEALRGACVEYKNRNEDIAEIKGVSYTKKRDINIEVKNIKKVPKDFLTIDEDKIRKYLDIMPNREIDGLIITPKETTGIRITPKHFEINLIENKKEVE